MKAANAMAGATGRHLASALSDLHYIFEGLRKIFPRQLFVDYAHRIIRDPIEILLGRHHFTCKEQVQSGSVQIATSERLGPKIVPERMQECCIDAVFRR